LETRGPTHSAEIRAVLAETGYGVDE
jgi:hypothetical protein